MRSWLFVPADSERKLARAAESGADVLILDLEDSVANDRKAQARRLAREVLASLARSEDGASSGPQWYVRCNPLDACALDDLDAVMPGRPDGIVLPKATPEGVATLDRYLDAFETVNGIARGTTRICAIATETPAALFAMGDYAAVSARLVALTWGIEDLSAALGASARRTDGSFDDTGRLARTLCVLAAGAAGVAAIDTVHVDLSDDGALRAEAVDARRAGFAGKLAVHPAQLETINACFEPSEEELAWARRVVDAFAGGAAAGGTGVGQVDGKMVDRPHLLFAQRLIAHRRERPRPPQRP